MRVLRLLLAAALLTLSQAAFPQIRDIETHVVLSRNGDAVVTQRWDVTITGGTEWYIPISNTGGRVIRDLQVQENGIPYLSDGRNWSSDRSLEEKTYRCGIVEKGGGDVELCWGQGRYGDHIYEITYVIENLVQAMEEGDGFHWHFLNDEWNDPPRHISLTLSAESPEEPWYWNNPEDANVRFWAFGFTGNTELKDGEIVLESTERFHYRDFVSLLVLFDKGMFLPETESDTPFETLKAEALSGSEYHDADAELDAEIAAFFKKVFSILFAYLFLRKFLKQSLKNLRESLRRTFRKVLGPRFNRAIFGKRHIRGWCREIPFDGNPTAVFSLLSQGEYYIDRQGGFGSLVGAYFLRWIQNGIVTVIRDEKKDTRFLLKFSDEQRSSEITDPMEREVYLAAREAAKDNLLLEKQEFESWSKKHCTEVMGWRQKAVTQGKKEWTDMSRPERRQVVQFMNFLKDFTLSQEREAPEVGLWKQYLVMAEVMGIAREVTRNFDRMYPRLMEDYALSVNLPNASYARVFLSGVDLTADAIVRAASSQYLLLRTPVRKSY